MATRAASCHSGYNGICASIVTYSHPTAYIMLRQTLRFQSSLMHCGCHACLTHERQAAFRSFRSSGPNMMMAQEQLHLSSFSRCSYKQTLRWDWAAWPQAGMSSSLSSTWTYRLSMAGSPFTELSMSWSGMCQRPRSQRCGSILALQSAAYAAISVASLA